MQFAGIRTSLDLTQIGEPNDILIKLTPDVLPEPDAILVHGVTPQRTLDEGYTETEFCKLFQTTIALPETIYIGFNSVRFDDEFVRYAMYRNFYEPYEWQWKEQRSRWDLLDPLRMMRALRPEGIKWPFDDKGGPTVRLELMTKENGLLHDNAHTAIADVQATIDLARLMKQAQPKLFDYLLSMRAKKEVQKFVDANKLFVYTSGKYSGEFLKTTVVQAIVKHPKRDAVIVYDLRQDPTELLDLSVQELTERWRAKWGSDIKRLPLKTMQFNRCPAIAPLSVLNEASRERIKIDMQAIQKHAALLQEHPEFIERIAQALGILEEKQEQFALENTGPVDAQLYASFWNENDKKQLLAVHTHPPATLAELLPKMHSSRLHKLLPLYKARNFPDLLTPEERDAYEVHRQEVLLGGGVTSRYALFMKRLEELSKVRQTTHEQYLLTELHLYAQSIVPYGAD
jgi:exodeoxyribonuclease-1